MVAVFQVSMCKYDLMFVNCTPYVEYKFVSRKCISKCRLPNFVHAGFSKHVVIGFVTLTYHVQQRYSRYCILKRPQALQLGLKTKSIYVYFSW